MNFVYEQKQAQYFFILLSSYNHIYFSLYKNISYMLLFKHTYIKISKEKKKLVVCLFVRKYSTNICI